MNTQKKWTIITGVIIVIVSVVVAWGAIPPSTRE